MRGTFFQQVNQSPVGLKTSAVSIIIMFTKIMFMKRALCLIIHLLNKNLTKRILARLALDLLQLGPFWSWIVIDAGRLGLIYFWNYHAHVSVKIIIDIQ